MRGQWQQAAARLPVDVGAVPSGSVCSSSGSRSVFLLAALFFPPLLFVTSHWAHADQPTPACASAAVGLKQTPPGANDQDPRRGAKHIVGWKEQLGPLASIRPSVCQFPDLFWLSTASSGDSPTLPRQPFRPRALVSLFSRWHSLGIKKCTFPLPPDPNNPHRFTLCGDKA